MGAVKDSQRISADGVPLRHGIAGVLTHARPNIVTRNGVTAELYRSDWNIGAHALQQVLHVQLRAGAISAWHLHRQQTDHIYCIAGHLQLVIYDPRADSPTSGQVESFLLHPSAPLLVVIPPGLWHGLRNLDSAQPASFINGFDRVYQHADPDEFRLPVDTSEIPFRF